MLCHNPNRRINFKPALKENNLQVSPKVKKRFIRSVCFAYKYKSVRLFANALKRFRQNILYKKAGPFFKRFPKQLAK